MAKQVFKLDPLEEAKYWVEQRQRDVNACTDYRQMPIYRKRLVEAQEEFNYQMAVNTK